ncbi:MAG TPA: hypothetical protein VFI13_01465 [Gemmatimonadales bacterium]|nr:hypothetical protein [Gemmatimonadales bacterium]
MARDSQSPPTPAPLGVTGAPPSPSGDPSSTEWRDTIGPDPQGIASLVDSGELEIPLKDWLRIHPRDSIVDFDATNYQPNSGGLGFESGIWCAAAIEDRSTDSTILVREAYFFPPSARAEFDPSDRRDRQDCTLGLIDVWFVVSGGPPSIRSIGAVRATWDTSTWTLLPARSETRPFQLDLRTGFRLSSGRRFRMGWRGNYRVNSAWNDPYFTDEGESGGSSPHRVHPEVAESQYWRTPDDFTVHVLGFQMERGIGTVMPGGESFERRRRPTASSQIPALLALSSRFRARADSTAALIGRFSAPLDTSSRSRLLAGPDGSSAVALVDSWRRLAKGADADAQTAKLWIHALARSAVGEGDAELRRADSAFVGALVARGVTVEWDHYNDGYYYVDNWLDSATEGWSAPGPAADSLFELSLAGRWDCRSEIGGTREDLGARFAKLRRWRGLVSRSMRPVVDLELAKVWSDSLAWSAYYLHQVKGARDSTVARYADALSGPNLPNRADQVWPEAWIIAMGLPPTRVWNYCSLND